MTVTLFPGPLSLTTPFRKEATISPCGRFRTRLARRSDYAGTMTFIMLNPSTADHMVDDPTIKRCIRFAVREGLGSIEVVNLFTHRSPDPRSLWRGDDPIGPDALSAIRRAIVTANPDDYVDKIRASSPKGSGWDTHPYDRIICAWGAPPPGAPEWFLRMRDEQIAEVRGYAADMGRSLWALGLTRDGHPKHPLARGVHRIPDDAPLIPVRSAKP